MDVLEQISQQVRNLPSDQQEQVLEYVSSLKHQPRTGQTGSQVLAALKDLYLDPASAREIAQAIEENCEQIDADEW